MEHTDVVLFNGKMKFVLDKIKDLEDVLFVKNWQDADKMKEAVKALPHPTWRFFFWCLLRDDKRINDVKAREVANVLFEEYFDQEEYDTHYEKVRRELDAYFPVWTAEESKGSQAKRLTALENKTPDKGDA
jgi:hypothetical protein